MKMESIRDPDDELMEQLRIPEAEVAALESRRDAYVAKQRAKSERGWAKINCQAGIALAKQTHDPAFALLFAIYDLIFTTGKNPISLTNVALEPYGIDRYVKRRGLPRLVEAGVSSTVSKLICSDMC